MYAYIDSFRKFGKTNTDNQSIKIKRPYPDGTPLFLCAFFFPALSLPRLFVPLRPFCSACLPLPEGGGCSSGKVRHTSGKGKSLDCQKRKGTALVGEGKTLGRKKRGARWERGGPLVREGKAVWSEGTPSGAGRLGRRGGHPVAGGPLRGEFPAERVPAEPEVEAR